MIAKKQHPTLTIDGLVFCLAQKVTGQASDREVALLMKCVTCGRGAYSAPIHNLVTLGEVIQEFQPNAKCGRCKDYSDHHQIVHNLNAQAENGNGHGKNNVREIGIRKNDYQEQRDPTIELMPNFSDLVMSL